MTFTAQILHDLRATDGYTPEEWRAEKHQAWQLKLTTEEAPPLDTVRDAFAELLAAGKVTKAGERYEWVRPVQKPEPQRTLFQ